MNRLGESGGVLAWLIAALLVSAAAAAAGYQLYLTQRELSAQRELNGKQQDIIDNLQLELTAQSAAGTTGSGLNLLITADVLRDITASLLPVEIDLVKTKKKKKPSKIEGTIMLDELNNLRISSRGVIMFSAKLTGHDVRFAKGLKGWKGLIGDSIVAERLPATGAGEMALSLGEDGKSLVMNFTIMNLQLGEVQIAGLGKRTRTWEIPAWVEKQALDALNEALAKKPTLVKLKFKPRPVVIGVSPFMLDTKLERLEYDKGQIRVRGHLTFTRTNPADAAELTADG